MFYMLSGWFPPNKKCKNKFKIISIGYAELIMDSDLLIHLNKRVNFSMFLYMFACLITILCEFVLMHVVYVLLNRNWKITERLEFLKKSDRKHGHYSIHGLNTVYVYSGRKDSQQMLWGQGEFL